MSKFVLKYEDKNCVRVQVFESEELEHGTLGMLKSLGQMKGFTFGRLVPDKLPPRPKDNLLEVAEEILRSNAKHPEWCVQQAHKRVSMAAHAQAVSSQVAL